MPTSPATAPDSSMAMTSIRLTLTPLATAAVCGPAGRAQVEAEHGPVEQHRVADADERPPRRRGRRPSSPASGISEMPGTRLDSGIGFVPMLLLPCVWTASRPGRSR